MRLHRHLRELANRRLLVRLFIIAKHQNATRNSRPSINRATIRANESTLISTQNVTLRRTVKLSRNFHTQRSANGLIRNPHDTLRDPRTPKRILRRRIIRNHHNRATPKTMSNRLRNPTRTIELSCYNLVLKEENQLSDIPSVRLRNRHRCISPAPVSIPQRSRSQRRQSPNNNPRLTLATSHNSDKRNTISQS